MKLQTKLIIAFSSVIIVMGLLQFFFFQQRIEKVFEEYVAENQQERIDFLKEILTDFYQYDESWNGIQEFIYDPSINRNRRGPMWRNNPTLVNMPNLEISIADQSGIIIADTNGEWIGLNADEVPGVHEKIIVNNQMIGELIINQEKSADLLTLERQFIQSVTKSILFGSIIAVIISVIIGLFIAARVTKPLEKLMIGIRHLTKGNKTYRLKINTRDEFHKLAEAFNEMSSQLEQNELIRKNLVADVAHELRTPLSILRGRLESIQEGAIEPTQEIVLQLNDEVYRLTRLVNDLQQLSLADAGKLSLNMMDVQINDLLKRIIDNFSWLADEKNIDLHLSANEKIMANIDTDRMTQVFVNLIGNALRHTPENGNVEIKVERNNPHNSVLITVVDNGIGIDPELLPYIFDRFYRTDSARNRDQGGTGLGLSIAKGFVEAHQGRIWAESKKNLGTAFIVEIPIKKTSSDKNHSVTI